MRNREKCLLETTIQNHQSADQLLQGVHHLKTEIKRSRDGIPERWTNISSDINRLVQPSLSSFELLYRPCSVSRPVRQQNYTNNFSIHTSITSSRILDQHQYKIPISQVVLYKHDKKSYLRRSLKVTEDIVSRMGTYLGSESRSQFSEKRLRT